MRTMWCGAARQAALAYLVASATIVGSGAFAEVPDAEGSAACLTKDPMLDLMRHSGTGGYAPYWDLPEFYDRFRTPGMPPLVHLGKYIFYEEGSPEAPPPIRTGYELDLYALMKESVRQYPGQLLTPERIFSMALRAGRDENGRTNMITAMLTAGNVMRLLARPSQWGNLQNEYRQPDPNDPLDKVYRDYMGEQSVGKDQTLPEILVAQNRMKVKTHEVTGKLGLGSSWGEVLFGIQVDPRRVFAAMPSAEDSSFNSGSHYYFWVGALAKVTGDSIGRDAASSLEFWQKILTGLEFDRARIQLGNYRTGGNLADRLRESLQHPIWTLTALKDPEIRRLGLHQMTWDAMVLRSSFVRDLELNMGNSRSYVELLAALEKVEQYETSFERVRIFRETSEQYREILGDVAPPDTEGPLQLDSMDASAIQALKIRVVKQIKMAIAPPATIRCIIEFDPPTATAAQKPVEGMFLLQAGTQRQEHVQGVREKAVEFTDIDDLDDFIRSGASIQLVLTKPIVVGQNETLKEGVWATGPLCSLVAEILFVVSIVEEVSSPGFQQNDSVSIDPRFLEKEYVRTEGDVLSGQFRLPDEKSLPFRGVELWLEKYETPEKTHEAMRLRDFPKLLRQFEEGAALRKTESVKHSEFNNGKEYFIFSEKDYFNGKTEWGPAGSTDAFLCLVYRKVFLIIVEIRGEVYASDFSKEFAEYVRKSIELINLRFPEPTQPLNPASQEGTLSPA